jgi:selenocysteine lyase/cysteine desulfurase
MESATLDLIRKIYSEQYGNNYIFSGPFGDRYLTYADYIASGQPLKFIEEYIQSIVLPTYANTHTEASFTGLQTSHYREEARALVKASVNAGENDVVIFNGSGSTGAIDLLYRKLQQFYQEEENKPVVFIGPYEHHSNVLPWREGEFDLIEVPINQQGNVDLEFLENKLAEFHGKKPLIGSFSAASNVTGVLAPVKDITRILKKYDALSFWDYAGAAPYMQIDMNPEGEDAKDALFISPHKLIGGPGTPGVLVVKKALFEKGLPVVTGGGTVHFVTKTQQRYFEDIEVREEAGTPGIIESIRAGMAFKLKDTVGAKNIEKLEEAYIKRAISQFAEHPNIYVLGSLEEPRLGFLAFHIRFNGRFLHHNFVVALLNDLFGIQSRGGCSCAGPYGHDLLDLSEEKSQGYMVELSTGNTGSKPGWVRLNFNYFIPEEEFQFIVNSLIWISEHGWKLMNAYSFDEDEALWLHKSRSKSKLNSIGDFITNQPVLNRGSDSERNEKRSSYFEEADRIAEESLREWNNVSVQVYKYNQVENPLRWYALANDVENL